MSATLFDSFNRRINYLRLSVTDRCNLRCVYCMPPEGVPSLRHEDILTYEELLRCAQIAVRLGVSKIRVTGGEPLLRRGIISFIQRLSALTGVTDLCLTTNGLLLEEFAKSLKQAGLHRINVSLDTLRPERFTLITRRSGLSTVLNGIDAAHKAMLHPLKINVVVIREVNLDEVADFAALTLDRPFEVRFIELMPLNGQSGWDASQVVPGQEIIATIARKYALQPEPDPVVPGSTARQFQLACAAGRIGVISPLSNHFCGYCNRIRLTPDGRLRLCLLSEHFHDVKTLLRSGADEAAIEELFRTAVREKPAAHSISLDDFRKCRSTMSRIGG